MMEKMIRCGSALGVAVLLWWPLSTWMMPRFAGAPTWNEDPYWYLTALMLGLAVFGGGALLKHWWLRRSRPQSS